MNKKVAIIGYGNLIRNDDAAGLLITEKLEKNYKKNEFIECFYSCSTADLIGLIEEYKLIYIIDCAIINTEPGRFIKKEINEIEFNDDNYSTHNISFNQIKETINKLDNKPKIFFFMLQPKNMEIGEKLSKEIKNNISVLSDTIQKEIQNYLNTN
jgi:hydrogenase maturation protease